MGVRVPVLCMGKFILTLFLVFWGDDKLRHIRSPLIVQVEVCIRLRNAAEGKTALATCLSNLVEASTEDTLLKSINLDLLMRTRSEDARLRLFALTCSETLWLAHGGKLLG
jgi:U3 small nucleolar RNA-associated protein 10